MNSKELIVIMVDALLLVKLKQVFSNSEIVSIEQSSLDVPCSAHHLNGD